MSIPVWPETLPQSPLIQGYTSTPVSSRLEFETEVGSPIVRNRANATPDNIREQYVFSTAQKNTFQTFWRNELKRGTVIFLKPDPENNHAQSLYQFRGGSEPVFTAVGIYWTTTFDLRRIPS